MKVVSGGVMEMLEVNLDSKKLFGLLFFSAPECLHRFCCLDPNSDTLMCQLVMFFVHAFA